MPFSVLEQLLGRQIDPDTAVQLTTYADWLATEGRVAGGIGPREAERVWQRHIYDSAAFARFWETPPNRCTDLGSGVGLPGLVLAMLWPESTVRLVDRAGRRVRLMRRATRILGLTNVEVAESDIEALSPGMEAIVMRAALPLLEASRACGRLLGSGGKAVVAVSRSAEPDLTVLPRPVDHPDLTMTVEAVKILDQTVWMLIMSRL